MRVNDEYNGSNTDEKLDGFINIQRSEALMEE